MLIDCESCRARGVGCSDCVISLFIDGADGVNPVDLNDSERQALEVLAEGGLAPPLRLVPMVPEPPSDGRQQVAAG
jgi:hypothetical protein